MNVTGDRGQEEERDNNEWVSEWVCGDRGQLLIQSFECIITRKWILYFSSQLPTYYLTKCVVMFTFRKRLKGRNIGSERFDWTHTDVIKKKLLLLIKKQNK